MIDLESIKAELQTGLKLLAFKNVKLELAPMAKVDEVLQSEGWKTISGITASGADGTVFTRFYYNSMQKTYAQVVCNGYTGECEIHSADETEMLESMTFEELRHLSTLIDKKSVAFIRIYAEKERASVKSEEELKALDARKEKMIAEAEVALRKR